MNLIENLKYYYKEIRANEPRFYSHCLIFSLSIIAIIYINERDYNAIHFAAEIYISIIGMITFIIVLNAHRASKQSAFLILGIGFGAVGLFNLLHGLAQGYNSWVTSNTYIEGIAEQLWICGELILVISLLITFILIYKDFKFSRFNEVLCLYTIISLILIFIVVKIGITNSLNIEFLGQVPLKWIIDFLVAIIFPVVVVILFECREKLSFRTFLFMVLSVIFLIAYGLISSINLYTSLIGHILKLISFFYVYKAIVEEALINPYEFLAHNLNEKTSQLKDTSEKLSEESKLRINLEKILLENEACYNLLIQNSQEALCIHSDGEILFVNERALKLIEISDLSEIIGRSIMEFVSEDTREELLNFLKIGYGQKPIIPISETKLITSSGKIVDVKIRSALFIYKGKLAMLSIFTDISINKQMEKLRLNVKEKQEALEESIEFNRSLTEFFSNISHELRTPLNVLLGSVQVLDMYNNLQNQDFDRNSRYLKTMKQNCYRLQRLVNNLIDISKIDSGYLELKMSDKNIVNIVEDISLSVVEYVESKSVSLTFDTNVEEKIMACDPDVIERIVLNLLSNAIKFTNPGDEIKVDLLDMESSIEISVEDTGIGIPEEKLDTIFKRFRQVDKSLRRSREGSGIGLSLVKSLVEMQNGTVSVESKVGIGSKFIVRLPVILVDELPHYIDNIYENQDSKVERINIEFSDIYS